jgi:LacI family transcriptional regulator
LAVDQLLDSPAPPSALMVSSHEAMFGVLPRLAERGVAVPSTMSIAGFEDAPLFQYWNPGITVLDTNPVELGRRALASLLSKIANRAEEASAEADQGPVDTVASRLIIRQSCAQLK